MNQKIGRSERGGGTAGAAADLPHNGAEIGEVLDAGPVLYLFSRTQEMRTKLQRGFHESWSAVYAMAMLRAVYNCPLSEMENCYNRSALRALFPNLSLSKHNIAYLFQGCMYFNSFWYMSTDIENCTVYLMLDGNRMLRDIQDLTPDTAGHPGKAHHLDQMNVLYAFTASDDGTTGMPMYFGHNSSYEFGREAFETECENMRMAKQLIGIGGREAAGDTLRTQLEEMGIPYIVRLRRGTDAAKEPLLDHVKEYTESAKVGVRAVSYHSVRQGDICRTAYLNMYTYGYDDSFRMRRDVIGALGEDPIRNAEPVEHFLPTYTADGYGSLEQVSEEERLAGGKKAHGTLTLQTYRLNLPEKKVYQLYKLRQQMEQLFQAYDALLPQDTDYLEDKFIEKSWLFLNHLASQMIADTWAHIRKVRRAKLITPQALYGRLSGVHCLRLNGNWAVPHIAEDLDAMCRKFGFDPTDLASLGIQ